MKLESSSNCKQETVTVQDNFNLPNVQTHLLFSLHVNTNPSSSSSFYIWTNSSHKTSASFIFILNIVGLFAAMKGNKTSPPGSAPTADAPDEPQTLTAHQLKLARAQAQAAMQAFLSRAALNVGAERPAGSGKTKVGADHSKRSA